MERVELRWSDITVADLFRERDLHTQFWYLDALVSEFGQLSRCRDAILNRETHESYFLHENQARCGWRSGTKGSETMITIPMQHQRAMNMFMHFVHRGIEFHGILGRNFSTSRLGHQRSRRSRSVLSSSTKGVGTGGFVCPETLLLSSRRCGCRQGVRTRTGMLRKCNLRFQNYEGQRGQILVYFTTTS